MRATDAVGAREIALDVVPELVRHHMLVEFIRVFGQISHQRDVLTACSQKNVPAVWLPQSTIKGGKVAVGATVAVMV